MYFGTIDPFRRKPLTILARFVLFLFAIPLGGAIFLFVFGVIPGFFLLDPAEAAVAIAVVAGVLVAMALIMFLLFEVGLIRFDQLEDDGAGSALAK